LLLGVLAAAELWVTADRLLVLAPASRLASAGDVAARVVEGGASPSGPVRVASSPRALTDLSAALSGIEKTNTNDSFQIQHAALLYERLYPFLEDLATPLAAKQATGEIVARDPMAVARTVLDRFAVRWVATTRITGLDREPGLCRLVETEPGVHLLENTSALPRCYVVPHVECAGRHSGPVYEVLGRVNPRKAVVLKRDPLPPGKRQQFKPGRWLSDDPDRVRIQVETEAPGLLVVANTWMPGWEARVDGRIEPVFKGDFWQQTIPIRQGGRHEVVLTYEPPGWRWGATLTGVALTLWVGMVVQVAWARIRRARPVA
jgi:hypothetical protein